MSTSEAIASTSAPQIASAASSVQPPANTASRAKSSCSAGVEQVVAPGDRRAQRPLPFGRRARAAGEQGQPLLEPLEQHRRREQPSRARRRARSRAAGSRGVGRSRRPRRSREIGADGERALHEEVDRLRSRNGSTATSHSPSTWRGSRLVTSTVRCGQDPIVSATSGGCVEQVLEVVEHEQQPLVADLSQRACPSIRAPELRPSRRARNRRPQRAATHQTPRS